MLGIGALGQLALGEFPGALGIAPVATVGSSITGGYFSRKRWHALIGEIEAERQAALAGSVKLAKQRKVVAEAARVAMETITAARQAQESQRLAAELQAMNRTLESAAAAKSLAMALERAQAATAYARSAKAMMIAYQDDIDDEEEAVALLLLH